MASPELIQLISVAHRLNDWPLFDQITQGVFYCLALDSKRSRVVTFVTELIKFYMYVRRFAPMATLFHLLAEYLQEAGELELALLLYFNALKFAFATRNHKVDSPVTKTAV